MHKHSENCVICNILKSSGVEIHALTPSERAKLEEIDKNLKKEEDELITKIDEIKKKNEEYLKKIEDIIKKVEPDWELELHYTASVLTMYPRKIHESEHNVAILKEEPSKEILNKLDPKQLEEYEYYEAKVKVQYKQVNHLKLKRDSGSLDSVINEIFRTKSKKDDYGNLSFKHNNRKYEIWILFRHESVLEQVEKILDLIGKREKVKHHYDIHKDSKFLELLKKFDLKDETKEGKPGLALRINNDERIMLSDTGRLRYNAPKKSSQDRLLLMKDIPEGEEFTKEDYYAFLDKIDSFLTKKRKKEMNG